MGPQSRSSRARQAKRKAQDVNAMPAESVPREQPPPGATPRPRHFVYAAKGRLVRGRISCADAVDFLKTLPANCARVVFLDPPFNLGKRYDRRKDLDRRSEHEYRRWLGNVLTEGARALEPGGALFLYHIPLWAMRLGNQLDGSLNFIQWIAVSMKNGYPRGHRLYPAHYALLMFGKGDLKKFVRPKIAPPECKNCGELLRDYGGYKHIILRKGINLTDIWDDLSPVRHRNRKHREANELPELLFHRILRMVGQRNTLYVDPFAGSGSGVLAAAKRGMTFAACDAVYANCAIISRRLKELRRLQERRAKK